MALSAFDDPKAPPAARDVVTALGKAHAAWKELRSLAGKGLEEEWGFSSKASGWSLRLRDRKRVILYLTPQNGRFLASLALGEKAVAAAQKADLPPALLAAVAAAPRYAEGRGVRVEVRTTADARGVAALAAVKRAG
jgi:hypothetical protein